MSLDFWGTAAPPLPVPTPRPAQRSAAPAHTWGHVPPAAHPTSWAQILDSPEPPAPDRLAHRPRAKRTALIAVRTLLACVTIAAIAVDVHAAAEVAPAVLELLGR